MQTRNIVLAAASCLVASFATLSWWEPLEPIPLHLLSTLRGTHNGYAQVRLAGIPLFTNCAAQNALPGLPQYTASCADKPNGVECIVCDEGNGRYPLINDQDVVPLGYHPDLQNPSIDCDGVVSYGICVDGECIPQSPSVAPCSNDVDRYVTQLRPIDPLRGGN